MFLKSVLESAFPAHRHSLLAAALCSMVLEAVFFSLGACVLA